MTTTINADNVTGGAVVTGDSSGELGLQTAGTTRMTITSAGNVGVGTTSPSVKLHVKKLDEAFRLQSDTASSALYQTLYNSAGTRRMYQGYAGASTSDYTVMNEESGAIAFGTNSSERMRIDSSGNVGIGTSSPGAWLDVYAPDATTSKIRIGNYGSGSAASYPMIESFGCRNDGNGGFFGRFGASYRRSDGTAIASGAIIGAYAFGGQYGTATGYTAANLLYTAGVYGVAEGSFTSSSAMATAITFCTGSTGAASTNFGYFGTERMRIDSSGNVGIGTTPSVKLDIYGTNGGVSTGNESIRIRAASTSDWLTFGVDSTNRRGWIRALRDGTGENELTLQPLGGETIVGGVTDNGAYNLQCNGTGVWGAGAYVNGSDARIKDDIAPLASGLDVVEKLNPVTFRYKQSWSKDTSIQPGFIAQELQTALDGKDYVDGVVQQGPECMSVAYQSLIPILTKAIQEQQQQIDALKAEVAALKGE